MFPSLQFVFYVLLVGIPAFYLFHLHRRLQSTSPNTPTTAPPSSPSDPKPVKNIMQPPRDDLQPPKDDPFTLDQLNQFDGTNPNKPIYLSIKGKITITTPQTKQSAQIIIPGTVFDVSHKKDIYGPGKSYNVFAGKDGSKGLGMSSLKIEDAVPDYSGLSENDMKVLNDWHGFFSKRYNIVGRVTDHPVPTQ